MGDIFSISRSRVSSARIFFIIKLLIHGPLARERDLFFTFPLFVAMSGSELESPVQDMGGNKETQRIHSDAF